MCDDRADAFAGPACDTAADRGSHRRANPVAVTGTDGDGRVDTEADPGTDIEPLGDRLMRRSNV